MNKTTWTIALTVVMLAVAGSFIVGCSSGSGSGAPPVPAIQNINSSTTPTSPVNLPIEINGSGFQAAPGKVVFTQGSITASVVPSASAWSDTGIVAIVPAGNGTTNFTLPGTVNVTVVTTGGTSNAVTLNLLGTFNFVPSAMAWATTTPLPVALTGLRAIGVQGAASTSAYVVVTGGYDGTANGPNSSKVFWNTLNADGTVGTPGASWTTLTTNPLPSPRAHHAMAEADDTNSLVGVGKRYIYVIGGQQNSTDTPGGTNTIYMASVDATTGAVGTWAALSNVLPQALLGMSATVHNGYLYVVGGLTTSGAVSSAVYTAPINTDGTVGAWTTAANPLPTATAFGTMLVFGGHIYWIDGDQAPSLAPNSQTTGVTDVFYADAIRGVVGTWALNPNLTIHNRAKGLLYAAYGQLISAEGVYTGSPGSGEMETSTFNANGTLGAWNGLTGSQDPSADVYNAAGFVSPLVTSTNAPRFLILGGQAFSPTPPGALSSTVYYNTKP
jgi:hypothetical protein